MQNRFATNDGSVVYDWPINHKPDGEGALGQARELTREASTGLVGGVVQQGDDGPVVLKMSGHIETEAQHIAFWDWFHRCKTETIYFRDFAGSEYEVLFTSYQPTRVGVIWNPRDNSIPHHRYTYDMELTVIQVYSGPMAGRVTP